MAWEKRVVFLGLIVAFGNSSLSVRTMNPSAANPADREPLIMASLAMTPGSSIVSITRCWAFSGFHDTTSIADPGVMARLAIIKGSLSAGFAAEGFMVLTDKELFPKATMSPKKTTRFSQAISRLEDLHEGDYVVHRDYGIGVFRCINAMTVDGVTRDYISLQYKDHSLLHVPVERLGYLEKYVGDRTEITLDEPGSRKWKRARKEAAEDARRIAHELLETAAKRHSREGYMFKPNPEL